MVYSEYTWVFVCSIIVAFIAAFGIGANDLANSFATSVGTKALKMWQAVAIAAVCEWSGAFFLGASVTDTVKSGIVDVEQFTYKPDVFLYGMFTVMIAAAFWDNMACHLGLPVSTTHTTIGAIIGMALVADGGDGVVWYASKDEFPYFKGFAAVAASWVVSPLCSFISVGCVFFLLRLCVLRQKKAFTIAFWLMPLFVGATIGLIVGYICITGAKNGTWQDHSDGFWAWVATIFAVAAALFTLAVFMPLIKKSSIRDEEKLEAAIKARTAAGAAGLDGDKIKSLEDGVPVEDIAEGKHTHSYSHVDRDLLAEAINDVDDAPSDSAWALACARTYHRIVDSKAGTVIFKNKLAKMLGYSLFYNIHTVKDSDKRVASIWAHAEIFDFKTERMFRYLQVFTAMAMSFAHGSNDVANAMGPFTAVYQTWENSAVPGSKSNVETWILAYGGAGIVLGLATFGYKIMRVLGCEAVKLTPTRGFVCEWCTALVVLIASRYGLPISTTQVITGAIFSVGLFEGRKGVNWFLMVKVLCGWVITVCIAGCIAAFFSAVAFYSPNVWQTERVASASQAINSQTEDQLKDLAKLADANNDPELAATVAQLTQQWFAESNLTDYNIESIADTQVTTFDLYNQEQCTADA